MSKSIFLFTTFFIAFFIINAQTSVAYMDFSTPKKDLFDKNISLYFFNKILIIDNRFDTSSNVYFGYKKGIKGVVLTKWKNPVKESIQNYIEAATANISKKNSTLIVELLHYELNGYRFYFKVNAYYLKDSDDYIKFISIDTVFKKRPEKFIQGGAIDFFLKKIIYNRNFINDSNANSVSFQFILNDQVQNEWRKLSINQTKKYNDGIYETFQSFKINRPDYYRISLTQVQDSLFEVTFTDTLKEIKRHLAAWLNYFYGRGIICKSGKLYYLLDYKYCIPLSAINNTFYFHIPQLLPNMFYQNEIATNELSPININTTSGAALGISTITGSLLKSQQIKTSKREGSADNSMRDCYIDLDYGTVNYH